MKHQSYKELKMAFPSDPQLISLLMVEENIGAFSFCQQALAMNYDAAVEGLKRMDELHVCNKWLYCFWNDCFDRNTELAIQAMNECPEEIILEALDGISEHRFNFKQIRLEGGAWKLLKR